MPCTTGHIQELVDGIAKYFESGEFSDFEIHCQGKVFKVHKLVISSRSPVLFKACSSGFKEAGQGYIDLPDDDPIFVKAMIRGIYGQEYFYDEYVTDCGNELKHLFDALLYALADKYDIQGLKKVAAKKFSHHLSDECCPSPKKDKSMSFEADVGQLVTAIKTVFTTTPSSDLGLRDEVVSFICPHIRTLVRHEAFRDLIYGPNILDGFAGQLLIRGAELGGICSSEQSMQSARAVIAEMEEEIKIIKSKLADGSNTAMKVYLTRKLRQLVHKLRLAKSHCTMDVDSDSESSSDSLED